MPDAPKTSVFDEDRWSSHRKGWCLTVEIKSLGDGATLFVPNVVLAAEADYRTARNSIRFASEKDAVEAAIMEVAVLRCGLDDALRDLESRLSRCSEAKHEV